MQRIRWPIAVLLTLALYGSLSVSVGYAWYLRSDAYRSSAEQRLSSYIELPSDIGGVVPRSWFAREFRDVVVWLPQKRDRVEALRTASALLALTPTPAEPDAYEIDLRGGSAEISTRTWLRGELRGVVESGLRTGFIPGGPRRVSFRDMNLSFERDHFRAAFTGASGEVSFEDAQVGRAYLLSRRFNGFDIAEPVLLEAEFSSQPAGVRIDRLDLKVPRLPLSVVRLQDLAGVPLEHGFFDGRLIYHETATGRDVSVAGKCFELNLGELTGGVLARPLPGGCPEVELQELRVENGQLARLRFRGLLREVGLGELGANWGVSDVGGTATLRVGEAALGPEGIERFVAAGEYVAISLEALTGGLGYGRMSGTLHVVIEDLLVENNRLKRLDALVRVDDAGEAPNWIEGKLLSEVVSRYFNVQLPPILPPRIEYTRLGLRLEVRDEQLTVHGTHGTDGRCILTIRLLGRAVLLVFEPDRPVDLTPWLDDARARAEKAIRERVPRK